MLNFAISDYDVSGSSRLIKVEKIKTMVASENLGVGGGNSLH
jgi:hypothetical protein